VLGPPGGEPLMALARVHWHDFQATALFGLIDGLNGAVGLIIGLLHSHAAAAIIFVALLARAGSSSVSMAGAQFESDDSSARMAKASKVAAMGAGYLASALLPGIGFAFSVRAGAIVFIPVTIIILTAITWARSHRVGWLKAAITTIVIFVLAVGAGLLASLAG
jgi:hypothetical protein